MKRLQPLAPLGPVRAHPLPALAIDSPLHRPTTAPLSPALPSSASPTSPPALSTPRSARSSATPRQDSAGQLPNLKRAAASQQPSEPEGRDAELTDARELERRKQRDMERVRDAQREEQAKITPRRLSSGGSGAAAGSLSPLSSARDAGSAAGSTTPPLTALASTALPSGSRASETPRRGKEALSSLSPLSARRALPPLVPLNRATSDSANSHASAALSPTPADKPHRDKKIKANRDKQRKVKTDRRAAQDESKEDEDNAPPSPAPLGDPESSASSADSSDSETEKEDAQADQELLHTLAATEPLAAAPIIAAVLPSIALSATQPLPDAAHEPHPPQFPPPLPYRPPTTPTSSTLSFYVGTWNLHGRPFPADSSLAGFLPPQPADVVCVGTEECDMSIERAVLLSGVDKGGKERWVRKVHAMIGQDEYVKVEEESMVAMHVVVFVRKELAAHVSGVDKARVATGVGNVIGNKGGVGVCMNLGSTSILFINSHFAAHQHAVDKRNADFWAISNKLNLRPKPPSILPSTTALPSLPLPSPPQTIRSSSSSAASQPASLVTDRFDRVFWLGDLNYRIEGTHRLVCHLLAADHLQPLLNNDQLTRQRTLHAAFPPHAFHEQPIAFRPTYKVDPGTEPTVYDSSRKARVPGWTDRVLWRDVEGGGGVEGCGYGSCEGVRSSDHFPVYARFRVRVDGMVAKAQEETKESEASGKGMEKKKLKKKGKEKAAKEQSSEAPNSAAQVKGKDRSTPPVTAAASGSDSTAVPAHAHHSSTSSQGGSVNSTVDSARAARGSVIDMSLGDGGPEDGTPRRSVSAVTADAPIATEQDSKVCVIM